MNFRIVVDPNELDPQIKDDLDATGIYVGYITFRSASAEFTPVRLKVTYINVRRPNEPNNTNGGGTGIRFDITRVGAGSVTSKLMIGTGLRATDGVDTLFGEFPYPDPQGTGVFSARLYSTNPEVTDHVNGLGDLTGMYESRDIRNVNADTTLIYKVRFERGAGFTTSQVTVTYDTEDFPSEGQLFIRDTLNGTRFSFDLRTAGTGLGGTRRSITINDAAISSFIIEYTLPKVIEYPVTRRGWNLLSLPVRPSSTSWDDIYPNRLTEQPIIYSKGIYQDAAVPKVGIGYFVRFGPVVDNKVAGTRLQRIDFRDEVNISTGWNTIGSLSVPVNIDRIQFDPIAGQPTPRRTGGVYGYVTDRGYVEVSELVPGLGYWLKVTEGSAFLKLIAETRGNSANTVSNQEVYANSAKISITDATHNGSLYIANPTVNTESFELPPLPPADLFDVRFTNNSSVATGNAAIRIQGAEYPVNVAVENTNAQYTVVNAATGEIIGNIGKGESVQIADKKVGTIKLLQASNGAANFDVKVSPNPVSNVATITYSMPNAGVATVKVFNALGQEVQTLVSGAVAGATQELTFNASTLPSGQYLVKFVAGETVIVRTITVTH
ncbi:MAG: T9SS type A sorting domain-containing protein [Bacteroidota bacterium]